MPNCFVRLLPLVLCTASVAAHMQTSAQCATTPRGAIGETASCTVPMTLGGGAQKLVWPLTFSLAVGSDSLPSCLKLSPQSGVISGLVTKSCIGSTYRITVNATDSAGNAAGTGIFVLSIQAGANGVTITPAPSVSQTPPAPPPQPQPPAPPKKNDASINIQLPGPSQLLNSCKDKQQLLSAQNPQYAQYKNVCNTGSAPPSGATQKQLQALNPNNIICAGMPDFNIGTSIPGIVSFADNSIAACLSSPLLIQIGSFAEEKVAFRQLADVRNAAKCSDSMSNEIPCRNYICGMRILQQLATASAKYLTDCETLPAAQNDAGSSSGAAVTTTQGAKSSGLTVNQETILKQKAQFWQNLSSALTNSQNQEAINTGSYTLSEQITDPYLVTMNVSTGTSSGTKPAPSTTTASGSSTPGSGTSSADASNDAPAASTPSGTGTANSSAAQPPAPYSSPRLWGRIGLGIDVTGASSSDPAGRIMGDMSLQMPLRRTGCPKGANLLPIPEAVPNPPCIVYTPRSWITGLVRIDSIAQPGAVSGLASPTSYLSSNATSSTPEGEVYSIEAAIGYDFGLLTEKNLFRTRPYLTINMGAITPISPTQANPTVYDLTGAIENVYSTTTDNSIYSAVCPQAVTTPPTPIPDTNNQLLTGPSPGTPCYVAFLPEGRNHFYRHYEAGFRIRHFSPDSKENAEHYPAIFDAEVGQNEYVTGGMLRGLIGHFDGSTFLPGNPIHGLYLFGSMDLAFTKTQTFQSVLLETPTTTPLITAPTVAVINTPQANRDRWRLGFSMDIIEMIAERNKNKTANTPQ